MQGHQFLFLQPIVLDLSACACACHHQLGDDLQCRPIGSEFLPRCADRPAAGVRPVGWKSAAAAHCLCGAGSTVSIHSPLYWMFPRLLANISWVLILAGSGNLLHHVQASCGSGTCTRGLCSSCCVQLRQPSQASSWWTPHRALPLAWQPPAMQTVPVCSWILAAVPRHSPFPASGGIAPAPMGQKTSRMAAISLHS